MITASLDIGTNSVLLLVAEIKKSGEIIPLDSGIEEPRLGGDYTQTGKISDSALKDTIKAVRELVSRARNYGTEEIIAFGTEIFRKTDNGKSAAREIGKAAGINIEILTPELEAGYSYTGAFIGLPESTKNLVIDVGGGSTELIHGGKSPDKIASFPVGAVVLKEECNLIPPVAPEDIDYMWNRLEAVFGQFDLRHDNPRIIGVGGTITTLAATKRGFREYLPEKIHGTELTLEWIRSIFEDFSRKTPDEIASIIPFSPKRADIILAGTGIYVFIMKKLGFPEIIVSDRGARWGILKDLI